MSEKPQSWSKFSFWKVGMLAIFALLLLARIGYGQIQATDHKSMILQGSIELAPTQPIAGEDKGKIQPGTPVKIRVTVKNKGQQVSPTGQLYVRYSYAHPLEKEKGSLIFETEKKPLPSIEPGQKIDIAFDTPHQIPSLLDFIRDDWSLREYQAVALINEEEYMLSTLTMTFSAYYYPGMKKEFPIEIMPKH